VADPGRPPRGRPRRGRRRWCARAPGGRRVDGAARPAARPRRDRGVPRPPRPNRSPPRGDGRAAGPRATSGRARGLRPSSQCGGVPLRVPAPWRSAARSLGEPSPHPASSTNASRTPGATRATPPATISIAGRNRRPASVNSHRPSPARSATSPTSRNVQAITPSNPISATASTTSSSSSMARRRSNRSLVRVPESWGAGSGSSSASRPVAGGAADRGGLRGSPSRPVHSRSHVTSTGRSARSVRAT
jgi:hypothetical protein